jgi:zinc D-Ala-D-Ala dipeptidase
MVKEQISVQKCPSEFILISSIDSSIITNLSYYSENNFMGMQVDGYCSNNLLLTIDAANALSKAQDLFRLDGYSIVVYDGYRPQRAVNHFIRWASDLDDNKMKREFYPRIDKKNLFAFGYIAEKSQHSRGSTVDISIIDNGKKIHDYKYEQRILLDDYAFTYLNDGTVDMGVHFDFFDKSSSSVTKLVAKEYQECRDYLRDIMNKAGFLGYEKEWWHFNLNNEPYPNSYFDYVII